MAAKLKYYKLGSKASSFFCPKTRLKVVNSLPGKAAVPLARSSKAIIQALRNGHLVEIKEEEYSEMIEAEALKGDSKRKEIESVKVATEATSEISVSDFRKMNKDQMFTYYKDQYDVDKEDQEEFKALNKADMLEKLIELEEEEGE